MHIVRIRQGNSLKYLNNNRARIARSKKDSTDKTPKRAQNGATLGFEEKLWQAADKLRGHMDASEYKHVVLGLIFLKYISDAFEEVHSEIGREAGADPEYRDEYISRNIFWVPKEARWEEFQTNAKLKEIKLPDGKKGDIGVTAPNSSSSRAP
jgi:type I restriction enzyme M protein